MAKFKVGDLITSAEPDSLYFCTVVAVGCVRYLLAMTEGEDEFSRLIVEIDANLILVPSKKKYAFALIKTNNAWWLTDRLFSSKEEARKNRACLEEVIWPYAPDANGFVEIPE